MFKLVTDLVCTEILIAFHIVLKRITMNKDRHLKRIMTKFRFDVTELSVHYYRIEIIEGFEMSIMQNKNKEDEVHFVLCCPLLDGIITQFFSPQFCKHPLPF